MKFKRLIIKINQLNARLKIVSDFSSFDDKDKKKGNVIFAGSNTETKFCFKKDLTIYHSLPVITGNRDKKG